MCAVVEGSGQKALKAFQRGIELLNKQLAIVVRVFACFCLFLCFSSLFHFVSYLVLLQSGSEKEAIAKQMSHAFFFIAELYTTTELCDDENAEATAEQQLNNAVKAWSGNPEPYYGLANLRFLQHKIALEKCKELGEDTKDGAAALEQAKKLILQAGEAVQQCINHLDALGRPPLSFSILFYYCC